MNETILRNEFNYASTAIIFVVIGSFQIVVSISLVFFDNLWFFGQKLLATLILKLVQ